MALTLLPRALDWAGSGNVSENWSTLQWILAEGVEIKYSENVSALIFKRILFRVFVYIESITN